MKRPQQDDNDTSVSFLDVIACAFGAIALLVLILPIGDWGSETEAPAAADYGRLLFRLAGLESEVAALEREVAENNVLTAQAAAGPGGGGRGESQSSKPCGADPRGVRPAASAQRGHRRQPSHPGTGTGFAGRGQGAAGRHGAGRHSGGLGVHRLRGGHLRQRHGHARPDARHLGARGG